MLELRPVQLTTSASEPEAALCIKLSLATTTLMGSGGWVGGYGAALTQEVSREVDRHDDANRKNADDNQQADDVALEGQVVNSVLPTLLPNLFIPAGGRLNEFSLDVTLTT